MFPLYNPSKTYNENCIKGPFGFFAQKQVELFGYPLTIPFGIGAGILPNAKFIEAAWSWGFSIATYKTVRSDEYPTHPFPNVIKIRTKKPVRPGDTVVADFNVKNVDVDHDGITNSFAVPSKNPTEWVKDASNAVKETPKGSVLVLSFMGTKWKKEGRREFIEDFVKTCRLARKTKAHILEVNLSCPNFGAEGLVCNDLVMSQEVLEGLHAAKGNIPLLVKVGYFPKNKQQDLQKLLTIIHRFADGVVGINTISAKVVDKRGKQALPGSPVRLTSGVCGPVIRWAGLDFAKRAVAIKKSKRWKDFVIVGVGGVTRPKHFHEYMRLGVNAVESVTGAMWRPTLALEIRQTL